MGRKSQWWDARAKQGGKIQSPSKKNSRTIVVKENTGSAENDQKAMAGPKVDSVYRYFDKEEHADSFLLGSIFISTLERCRGYEDPLQGDPHEGYEFYSTDGPIIGNGTDPEFVRAAARGGVHIGPFAHQFSVNIESAETYLHDAYVLCTTIGFESDSLENNFGKYCVKIENVSAFFMALSKSICAKVGPIDAMHRSVKYADRLTVGMQEASGPIGFVKPSDKYADQREYRFMWVKKVEDSIEAMVVDCPEVAKYLTRMK